MVYLGLPNLKMVIFHGYVNHNQMVNLMFSTIQLWIHHPTGSATRITQLRRKTKRPKATLVNDNSLKAEPEDATKTHIKLPTGFVQIIECPKILMGYHNFLLST
jgi:hypothetical protein